MLLFDGRRSHAVSPFQGERYSLAFFTACDFFKARPADVALWESFSGTWPSDTYRHYWSTIISPPKGSSKSIRAMFGYDERPPAIQEGGTPLSKLGRNTVRIIIGFVLEPMSVPCLCVLASWLRDMALDAATWKGLVVDA